MDIKILSINHLYDEIAGSIKLLMRNEQAYENIKGGGLEGKV